MMIWRILVTVLACFFLFPFKGADCKESPLADISARSLTYTPERIIGDGDVRIVYEGIMILADHAEIDVTTNVVTARGNVTFLRDYDVLKGKELLYYLRTRRAWMRDISGKTRNLFQGVGSAGGDLFFWGEQIDWSPQESVISRGTFTTCDLGKDLYHYHIDSREIRYRPNDRLIAKDNIIWLQKTRIWRAGKLIISTSPQERKKRTFIPTVGYNRADGFIFRSLYNYDLGRSNYGSLHLDWLGKSGLGKGVEHYYSLRNNRGSGGFNFYQRDSKLTGSLRTDASFTQTYRISNSLFSYLWLGWSRDEFPGIYSSPLFSSQATFLDLGGRHTTRVAGVFARSGPADERKGVNVLHSAALSKTLNGNFLMEASYVRPLGPESRWLHGQGALFWEGKGISADLYYEKTMGSGRKNFVNREPELVVQKRASAFSNTLPYVATLSVGRFLESPRISDTSRLDYQVWVPPVSWKLGNRLSLFGSAGGRQSFYMWNTRTDARYAVNAHAGLQSPLSRNLDLRLDYRFQRPYGFSPVSFDAITSYRLMSGYASFSNKEQWRLNVGSGYDFDTRRWQTVLTRLDLTPRSSWNISLGSAYDLHQRTWYNLDTQCDVLLPKGLRFRYWGVYDLRNHKLTYQDLILSKDVHCWDAQMVYRWARRELWLQVNIKAFPGEEHSLGFQPTVPIQDFNWQNFQFR
ncbi:MAG: hypothetical protein HYU64_11805 [Armatimonadetes bacterium]|nr:hypothetical protein [Armatimonadota bacterium]